MACQAGCNCCKGACCYEVDGLPTCSQETCGDCEQLAGKFQGAGTVCEGVDCPCDPPADHLQCERCADGEHVQRCQDPDVCCDGVCLPEFGVCCTFYDQSLAENFPAFPGWPEPGCTDENTSPPVGRELCEECLCRDHADWVEVPCACPERECEEWEEAPCYDPPEASPDCKCPPGYTRSDAVTSDCQDPDGIEVCPDNYKLLCIKNLGTAAIVPCSEVGPIPTNCRGGSSNPGGHYSGNCGQFVPCGDCSTVDCDSVEPMVVKAATVIAAGPGTELKALLKTIGITASPTCSCNKRAKVMDEKGCDWCEEHIDEIDGWLAEEAKKRKLPYFSVAGKTLIRLAIRRARKRGTNR